VVKKGYVAEEVYDQVLANAAALEASVRADEANVESARLDHKYCSIRSPIDGVVGELKVNQGNLVKANDNEKPMVIIRQMSPIYVSFSIPERNLLDIKKFMAAGKLQMEAVIPGAEAQPIRGEVAFMENTVDTTTGTIQLKGAFSNDDKVLWPGQFVNVRLMLASEPNAVVVPSRAIQAGQEGQYVFVVKPDLTVEYRVVTVTRSLDGETVIEKGIDPGEKVVTDGHLRLAPGSSVKIVEDVDKGGAHS
jgi:membrane fusion protein, multidrug efflux system